LNAPIYKLNKWVFFQEFDFFCIGDTLMTRCNVRNN
jgi:hypothetical protein